MNRGCALARGVRAGPARSPVPVEREREKEVLQGFDLPREGITLLRLGYTKGRHSEIPH